MRIARIALALLAIAFGCGREREARSHDEMEGHAGAHDSAAADQRLLAAARGKPPVITLADLRDQLKLDDSLSAKVAPHVELLNAALVEITQLQQQYDAASSPAEKADLDQRASMAHVHADKHEDDLHNLLSSAQHEAFHRVLKDRAARFGLAVDEAHGDRLFGTAGSLYGVDATPANRNRP